YVARDTVFLPLHWLADCVPRAVGGRYRWEPAPGGDTGRLVELPIASPVTATPPPTPPTSSTAPVLPPSPASAPNPITGLRLRHGVVIDPGHGGVDPGNPGRYFPGRLVEKDITLAIGRLLRAELTRRAIVATLTRSTDTLIDLADRGALCKAACDLFVSIHVNAMPDGRRAAGGFHGAHHGSATRHSRRDRVRHESHRRRVSRFEPWPAQDRERDRGRHRRLLARARAQARRRRAGEGSVTLPPIRLFGVSFQNPVLLASGTAGFGHE